MNDISVILEQLDKDAKAQSAAILETAKENCRKIEADYKKQAEQQTRDILAAAAVNAEAIKLREASQSGIEERNLRLSTRRTSIDAAFANAMEKLCAMSDEKKVAFYSEMALAAISGPAELILNAADKAAIGKAVTAMVGKKLVSDGIGNVVDAITNLKLPDKNIARVIVLAEETGSFKGGFKLREGNIETNCTFEVLLDRAKEELEPDVARLLFS